MHSQIVMLPNDARKMKVTSSLRNTNLRVEMCDDGDIVNEDRSGVYWHRMMSRSYYIVNKYVILLPF